MITYDSVTKIFGTGQNAVTALRNVSFTVEKGHVVVLLGPSGCGKTTTLRLTNRLETLTQGTIEINGSDIHSIDAVKLRQSMGYVIQEIGLFPNKTIAENIGVVPKMLGWSKDTIDRRIDELFRMVNLDTETFRDRYPAELSGGQQQRIGVARGLAADPEILLMDEPFGAIDPINRTQIQDEFLRLQAKLKKTVVFVSHDIHEAIKVGDMIALFREGELVQYDTPELILTQPRNDFVADFVGADRALKVLGLQRVQDAVHQEPKNVVDRSMRTDEVLTCIEENHFEYMVVVDQAGCPIGYVTPKRLKHETGEVGDLAQPLPVVAGHRDALRDALGSMLMHDLMELCVVDDDGKLTGIVDYQDIQKSITEIYGNDETTRPGPSSAADEHDRG